MLVAADEDQGVVGILENRAREVRSNRVAQQALSRGFLEETLENIGHNDEKVGSP